MSAAAAPLEFGGYVCAAPPTNPTGRGAILAGPAPGDPARIAVTLAAAASNGGITASQKYRVVLTQVAPAAGRRLHAAAAATVAKTQASRAFLFVAGQAADGESGAEAARLG